ncbi:hypothetical protein [Streptomyces sp. NPDC093089]|uniref:hypothetical protein n=1 Tax=Streptomyces sp. NPDC093089 TaxID=3366024 RepID=UPI00380BC445
MLHWRRQRSTDRSPTRGAAAVAGIESGGEGAPVLLVGLQEYVLLPGWIALAAPTGAVLLGRARDA